MPDTFLELSWAVSKGRETMGYNIARLRDTDTGKRFRALGGGYDMQGTVFAEWLEETYQDRLLAIQERAHHRVEIAGVLPRETTDAGYALYGMTVRYYFGNPGLPQVSLDGAAGLESMFRIAEAIGLSLKRIVYRKGNLTGIIVRDTK